MAMAFEKVTEICSQVSIGLHPAGDVSEEDWQAWLNGWAGIPEAKVCPKCGRQMLLKSGRYGVFYGCSAYPECKHTERADA